MQDAEQSVYLALRLALRGLQFFSGDDELFPTLIPLKP